MKAKLEEAGASVTLK
ncbi:hypothetical protein ACLVUW_12070 [Streptococcus pneumoniae]|nr:hypothetical protein [Streptococcus pneumoniae]MDU2075123.1 hypothetical protein [Streptococcus salivarius]MDS4864993.1 hypothetical protein [Streptococcus pneumoniae]MDS5336495.1 hypothetical protein [Streptococcus pneumoniae]MDS5742995.1 hypothetical protein [Streptococcus pneumoniae]